MKRFELKYYFMTPIFVFIIFALVFIQISIFSVQKIEQEKLYSLELANEQYYVLLRKAMIPIAESRLQEYPDEAWEKYMPDGMEIAEYKELTKQFFADNLKIAQRFYEFLEQDINSEDSLYVDVAYCFLDWQNITQFDYGYMNKEQKTFLLTPGEYFGEKRWSEIKREFELSDYRGITIFDEQSYVDDLNARQGVIEHESQVKALYKLKLYEEHHLPVSRYSTNGYIAGIFQRNMMYNVICFILTVSASLMILFTLKQDRLDRSYYLALGRKRYYRHRLGLLFNMAFIPLVFMEIIMLSIRNMIDPGVRLSYPVMAAGLTESFKYSSRMPLTEVEIGPLPLVLQRYQDFLKLKIYPVWLLLLLNLIYLILLVALVASMMNFIYSILATKKLKTIIFSFTMLVIPFTILFMMYPFELLANLLDTSKLLSGQGPWPYAYTLIGLGVFVGLLNLIGSNIYEKTKNVD